ncbi:MAG: hypothetical protein JRE63_03255 [Deltaproteobacteria bacterium]|jgi:hypothetical protein|nr:hypothetical protein [Deltaproteobacteria bacterium]
MFHWDKAMNSLNISAGQILSLFRSMRDVQLVLPGLPVQQATAYLCQFQQQKGAATVAAFHMHKSQRLAFYCSEPKLVGLEQADKIFEQGLVFVESMGFLLADLDVHLLPEKDRSMLWSSLPLAEGISSDDGKAHDGQEAAKSTQNLGMSTAGKDHHKPVQHEVKPNPLLAEPASLGKDQNVADPTDNQVQQHPENADNLLAAVEALRSKRPGFHARKRAMNMEEFRSRCRHLQQNIGRILASL